MAREPNDYALRSIHADRVVKRQIDELIGLSKGALLDGNVGQHGADGILVWLHGNVECLDTWPASVLYDRLRAMLTDGGLLSVGLVKTKPATKRPARSGPLELCEIAGLSCFLLRFA
ncbi:hypothetical protein C667_04099 [Thauera phenylacetica B4P]|uniref:Uncharacterized protein n=1 Tax=Thauera phenylacetica B4P TaxID=1234382 RepID=N6YVW9_9RHOO|nr:hypothetical protein [Thauera phenylacetica]ENO98381.1 hypothetical protein C667_04099 [Thauera phenylacetica B4P]